MSKSLALWEGIDVEHMIVDATTLDVKPIADRLLAEARGEGSRPGRVVPGQVDRGPVTWSNELALHVIGRASGARPRERAACLPREREPYPFCRWRGGARASGLEGRVPGGHFGAHLR